MQDVDLQAQAVRLIRQLSTERLNEAVNFLAELQHKDENNIIAIPNAEEIPERDLERISTIFSNRLEE